MTSVAFQKRTTVTLTREEINDVMNDPRLLDPDTEPHMTRETGDFEISCTFQPDLANATTAVVTIFHAGVLVDSTEIPATEALAAYRHPTHWSEQYRLANEVVRERSHEEA